MNSIHSVISRAAAVLLAFAMAAPFGLARAQGQGQQGPGAMITAGDNVMWTVPFANAGAELRISGPDGVFIKHRFDSGRKPTLSVIYNEYGPLPDGQYTYELRPFRKEPPGQSSREHPLGEHFSERRSDIHSGAFRILDGRVVDNTVTEESSSNGPHKANLQGSLKDQVILDDLIVDGSTCIGFDCVNGEAFGFDTLRLKENNTRIRFFDTSNSGSFPTRDWELTANDSANGGLNRFSIRDVDAARDVFTVEGNAPSHSLYVDDGGRVGFGTSSPVVENHIVDGDTPTVRLEQDGSSGFSPQTWDVAGNETNFFVRDTTNGSTLPFRIRPSAPSNSVHIASDGKVGIGTASPSSAMHVRRTDGSAMMLVEEANATAASRELLRLKNNGSPFFIFEDSNLSQSYSFAMGATGHFLISHQQTSGVQMRLEPNGNMTIQGTLTEGSSRAIKDKIVEVDNGTLLGKLERLPISEWNYDGDQDSRHLGPMAEDFHALFGLGSDNRHVAPKDLAGVALAAAKALKAENENLKKESIEKDERIESLETRIERLEELVLDSR